MESSSLNKTAGADRMPILDENRAEYDIVRQIQRVEIMRQNHYIKVALLRSLAAIGIILGLQASAKTIKNDLPARKKIGMHGENLPSSFDLSSLDGIGRISNISNGQVFGYGTVSHVGKGYVVTAGHVISEKTCPIAQIEWGARENKNVLVSKCLKVIYREVGRYKDLAVFKVDRYPNSKVELSKVSGIHEFETGDDVFLLGHMGGSDLLLAEGWASQFIKTTSFSSYLPSGSGDSGAPVFSMESGNIVGIYSGREGLKSISTKITSLLHKIPHIEVIK